MNVNVSGVLKGVSQILRAPVSETEPGTYSLKYMGRDLVFTSADIDEAVEVINSFAGIGDTCAITKTSYETLVNIGSPIRSIYGRLDLIKVEEEHTGISYRVGSPSEYFVIYLWLKLEGQPSIVRSNLLRHPSGSARE